MLLLLIFIRTDKEYTHDRLPREDWPHLLIEQFFKGVNLSKLDNLMVDIDFELLSFEDHMGERKKDLHSLQIGWDLSIDNQNKKSKGYKDFFWFGMPFIDMPRFPKGQPYEAADLGKDDCTGKYIISMDPTYVNGPV